MFHAKAAALRSAEMGRQVGAAIATDEGDIVAVGTNDVPKGGGGLYWCGDEQDKREFRLGHDSNSEHKRNLLADVLDHLQREGWLSGENTWARVNNENRKVDVRDLVKRALDPDKPVLPPGCQFRNLIEFGRAVHAEMAALMDAARRGIRVQGCTMFVTTFPCHMCARHIVAAGIKKVVYIEPYAKSLAAELYPDSIEVEAKAEDGQVAFEPFLGVAPRQYMHLFKAVKRITADGKAVAFDPKKAKPRCESLPAVYLENEYRKLAVLERVKEATLF